jgi:hypothetical protein
MTTTVAPRRRMAAEVPAVGVYRTPRHLVNTPGSFWSRVDQSGDCWPWTGAIGGPGYGELTRNGQVLTTHRLAYELARGPIPPGMCVCHTCDNKACCRPSHLWLGTHGDNMRDAADKGLLNRGEANGQARLTATVVVEIRREISAGAAILTLARRYGVHPETVRKAAKGETWSWL